MLKFNHNQKFIAEVAFLYTVKLEDSYYVKLKCFLFESRQLKTILLMKSCSVLSRIPKISIKFIPIVLFLRL